MDILPFVLAHKPREWQETTYGASSCRYKLYDLYSHSTEYNNIARYFAYDDIHSIKRVQHPYAFGRFLLRKEQLRRRSLVPGRTVRESFMFHGIDGEDEHSALEYNCDPRYYNYSDDVIPDFSPNPDDSSTIIVVKHLCGNLTPKDSNYYPAYLVNLYDY